MPVVFSGSAHCVMFIHLGNGHDNTSSNPGQG